MYVTMCLWKCVYVLCPDMCIFVLGDVHECRCGCVGACTYHVHVWCEQVFVGRAGVRVCLWLCLCVHAYNHGSYLTELGDTCVGAVFEQSLGPVT